VLAGYCLGCLARRLPLRLRVVLLAGVVALRQAIG
jgi:hypothetical protein